MTFKTNLDPGACPALGGISLLAVSGRDAAAFLQAQTMNDVASLAPGHWQWNGWLTPKGRVIALFALLRLAPERCLLVLPDFPAAELQPLLQRFVFRSQVRLDSQPALVAAAGPLPADIDPWHWTGDEAQGIGLAAGPPGDPRGLWLLPAGHPALAAPTPATDAAWFAADLDSGLPRLPVEGREAWTPQMLSLDRLAAFSLRKGCYPGQEIVARTHYLGQAKRGLVRLGGSGLAAGAAVSADGAAAGTVVCSTPGGDRALAVLALDAGEALAVDGQPCQRLPLPPPG